MGSWLKRLLINITLKYLNVCISLMSQCAIVPLNNKPGFLITDWIHTFMHIKSKKKIHVWLGLGTELGTFKGTDRIASELPSTDSQKITKFQYLRTHLGTHMWERERVRESERERIWARIWERTFGCAYERERESERAFGHVYEREIERESAFGRV